VTNDSLRIAKNQVSGGERERFLAVWADGPTGDTVSRSFGRVAEWQTRWLQVPVSFGTWGFKSPFAHSESKVTASKEVGTFVLWWPLWFRLGVAGRIGERVKYQGVPGLSYAGRRALREGPIAAVSDWIRRQSRVLA
jgi:hypothetical protein